MFKFRKACDMKKEDVDAIVIHCSATRRGADIRAAEIERWHRNRGYKQIGYHYVVDIDGTIENGRPTNLQGAHCKSSGFSGKPYNSHSIGICYVGGLDSNGKIADTRTEEQKKSLLELISRLLVEFPNIKEILGHRDTSPDKNGNGVVERCEWLKGCPSFDAVSEYSYLLNK